MIDITDKKGLENIFSLDFGSPYFPILAELYLQEGDLRRAKLVCSLGLEHSPENDCGKFILAKVALAEEKPFVAEKWLKSVVQDNPANFNALRLLIRLEFALGRSHNTVKKYIYYILQFLPKDFECHRWLENLAEISDKSIIDENVKHEKNDGEIANGTPMHKPKHIEEIDYELEESMATFTMLQVLKKQRHYQQALAVLKLLQSKNMDADRISKERSEILSLISRNTKT